jgi:hypothetical protein
MGRTPGKPTASARAPVRLFASLMESTLSPRFRTPRHAAGRAAPTGPRPGRSLVELHLPGGAGNRHFVRPLASGNQVKARLVLRGCPKDSDM